MQTPLTSAHLAQGEYKLVANHPLRLLHAAGRQIKCLSGTAWITAYGQNTDFLLRAGQSFQVPNDGLTLVEAIGHGSIHLAPQCQPRRPLGQALRHWLRGLR